MYKIIIPGRPVPKARPRLGYRGRTAYVYTPPETREYEKIVAFVASAVCRQPLTGDVQADIVLYFNPDAKVYTKKGKRRRALLPDVDNCVKALLDGLNKIAYLDDKQVAELHVKRRYDRRERAEVVLRRLNNEQQLS